MKFAIGTDMDLPVVHSIAQVLKERGFEVELYGAAVSPDAPWPKVAIEVARQVAEGKCNQAVLFCWTGTGISLAANKIKGIRAALCNDAQTAAGARKWNDANILAMSLRSVSEQIAKEILEAWLENQPSTDEEDVKAIKWLLEEEENIYNNR
jgi:ribose 5-phosphate isomerase B